MLHLFNLRQFINGFLFRDCTFVVVHELCEPVMLKFLLFFLSSFGSGSPLLTPAPKPLPPRISNKFSFLR